MNRRRFLQSLAAMASLPAAPSLAFSSTSAATSSVATAASVPANARFWAIYMSGLHGECQPQTLQNMLNIPAVDAKKYIGQLVADGTIKPNPLLKRTLSEFVKRKDKSVVDRLKKRLDMKTQAQDITEPLDDHLSVSEEISFDDNTGLDASTGEEEDHLQEETVEAEMPESRGANISAASD